MANVQKHNEWTGKTDGLPWMQRLLIVIFRVLPLWMAYSAMALVVPFYMIINREGYRASYSFFHDRLYYGRLKSFCYVYANHYRFGQVILDRFSMYAGKKYRFIIEGQDIMDELETHPESFVSLGSHTGNYEIAGYSLKPKSKRFNALMYSGETDTVLENRNRLLSKNNMRAIFVKEDLSHLFELNAAIDNGEIISIYADRRFGSQKYVECDFLGSQAPFPMGAFAIAVKKKLPVLAVFVMKESMKIYHSYVLKLPINRQLNINEQVGILAQDYANKLEMIIREYPTQWFNYFDFWKI